MPYGTKLKPLITIALAGIAITTAPVAALANLVFGTKIDIAVYNRDSHGNNIDTPHNGMLYCFDTSTGNATSIDQPFSAVFGNNYVMFEGVFASGKGPYVLAMYDFQAAKMTSLMLLAPLKN